VIVQPVSSVAPAFNDARFVLLAPWGRIASIAALVVAAAIVGLAVYGYRHEPRRRRALLVGLRTAAAMCALVLFFQPARELRHLLTQPNHIAVVVDESASMSLSETPGDETRSQRVAELIRDNHDVFQKWQADHRVDYYTFGSQLVPTTEAALAANTSNAPPASQPTTHIREALAELRGRYDGDDLGGVVLVSDGIDNGRLAAEAGTGETHDFLTSLATRVHTAWAARPGIKDVALERVVASDFAFVHTVVKVDAVVRVAGYGPLDLPVTLSQDGQPVRTQVVHVDPTAPGAEPPRVEFEFTPDKVGKVIYALSVPVQDGEAVTTNNRLEFVLKVIRDKVRVLQVAGRPSTDERFLRALLKRDPNVDLISFFILRTPYNLQLVSEDELSLIPFPTDELFGRQLPSFDLIVMQNFNYGPYNMGQYLGAIRDYVQGGGGLAMVGGDLSFGAGGYAGTPVADVLPVTMPFGGDGGFEGAIPDPGGFGEDNPELEQDQEEMENGFVPPGFSNTPAADLFTTDPFHPQLTDAGERFPITALRLDRQENDAFWSELPPLDGANLLSGAQPNAVVLAVHPTLKGDDGQPMPVLAVAEEGKGRSMALATDSSWQWGFSPSAVDDAEQENAYQTFWENSIRWLIHDPDYDLVHIDTDQSEYAPGAPVHIDVRVLDASYQPSKAHSLRVTVARDEPAAAGPVSSGGSAAGQTSPGDTGVETRQALTTDDTGHASLDLTPSRTGAYRITADSDVGGRAVTSQEVFLVRGESEELSDVAGREDLLREVADTTGGTYLGTDTDLSDLAFAPPKVIAVDRKQDVELWSHPLVFFLAVGFLAAEWVIRRRHGYV
jgi:uncharacterized membrane protein